MMLSNKNSTETKIITAGKKKRSVVVHFTETSEAQMRIDDRIDAAFDMIFDPLMTQQVGSQEVDNA